MNLISQSFFLLFFPVSLLVYWLVLRRPTAKLWFLCLLSVFFYALSGLRFVPLLLGLSLLTFWLAQYRRFGVGVVINLLALGLFKYWDFGADNLNELVVALDSPEIFPLLHLALPLGISFFVFKHIGYLLDVRQNRYPATRDFLAFVTFSAFFPQISAGPISSFGDTGAQLRALPTTLSSTQAYQGFMHISMGLAKKMLIADVLAGSLSATLYRPDVHDIGLLWAWSAVFIYAMQLYFDFSGYTDIALGIGYLLGVTLPPNFNNPYGATNPGQFWQRWHISLSLWFRLYLFTPLSRTLLKRWGTQHAERAQYTANMVTMLLVGLWHGTGWGYILWGGYHGLLLNGHAWLNRRFRPVISRLPFGPLPMFIAVLIGWALFLSPSMTFGLDLLGSMAGLDGLGSLDQLKSLYDLEIRLTTLVAVLIVFSGMTEAANLPVIRNPAYAFSFGVLAVLCLLRMNEVANFVYVMF